MATEMPIPQDYDRFIDTVDDKDDEESNPSVFEFFNNTDDSVEEL